MSSASLIKTPPEKVRVNGWVFYTSTALILLLTAILIIAPQEAGRMLGVAQAWLSKSFGWYYMVVIAAYLVFVVGLAFSSYGKLKLGSKDDTPDFSYGAWAGMLFSSGIGISLLYFGASEPLDHYFNPPEGTAASNGAARQALQLTFLHWGLHGWAIYALVGLAVAYFAYRHNQPLALRSALYPLVGERWVKGAAGHAVDGFGMFVTLLGLVTNLGIGSMQVSSGLENLFGMAHSNTNLLIVIIVMSTVATIAAVSGVENGIRRLSNLNIVLFSGLLIFVLLFGPTLHLLNGFVQNIGDYMNGIVLKTFDLYVYEGDADKTERWMGQLIRLPGYIVPLEVSEDGRTTDFLLVPYFGACIHVPPPPSNQIVHVTSKEGVKLDELYQPYWIVGALQVKPSTSELADAGYQMDAQKIVVYELPE